MRRLKSFAITAAILAIPLTSYGWTRTYGGEENEEAYWLDQTSDGGYIIIGYIESFEAKDADIGLIRTDAMGETVWIRLYGDARDDVGYSVLQTTDGGFIITGELHYPPPHDQSSGLCLVKTNAKGDILWSHLYGRTGGRPGRCVQETEDGCYIIAGCLAGHIWLLKADSLGETLWTSWYPGFWGFSYSYCVEELSDGGYIIVGNSELSGSSDLLLFKTDSLGDTLWSRIYGWEGVDRGYYLEQLPDGSYIVTGIRGGSSSSGGDLLLLKADSLGDTLWTRVYGSGNNADDCGRCIHVARDGGYVITGYTMANGWHGGDLWLLKTDSNGDILWERTYGWEGYLDRSYHFKETSDGGYILSGVTETEANRLDIWLLKTNEYGDTVWYEGEPRGVLVPHQDTLVDTIIPTAWFKNSGTYPAEDFYCHCEIWPKGGDTIATLSPPYHCKYLISYSLEPGDSIYVQFAEWFSDDSSRYIARFYTSKDSEPIWQTREKTVEFQGVPDVGITENPIVLAPAWELVNTVGQQITLRYSNYPQGFHGDIFDAAGRKVDELKSVDASGTITWGDTAPTGVYFIRISSGARSAMRKVILLR